VSPGAVTAPVLGLSLAPRNPIKLLIPICFPPKNGQKESLEASYSQGFLLPTY